MTEEEDERTPWDDGAATPIPATIQSGGSVTFANGPMVFVGYSAHNSGASPTSLEWTDGGMPLVHDQVGGTTYAQRAIPDRGVKVQTQLGLTVGANGPVAVVAYVRHKYMPEKTG